MATNPLPAGHSEIDWSNWSPPGEGDGTFPSPSILRADTRHLHYHTVRSPCPAINALANHNLLPHNGKGITKAMAVEALTKAVHLDSHIATIFAAGGVAANPDHSAHSFDLDHVDKHGYIEHDVSLSRDDVAFGDNHSFNKVLFEQVLSGLTSGSHGESSASSDNAGTTNWKLASQARYARVTSSGARHKMEGKERTYGLKESILSYGESALYLNLLGKDGVAPLEWVKILFGESSPLQ